MNAPDSRAPASDKPVLPPVDIRANLSERDFHREYFRPRKPVVLRGLMEQWPARTKWTFDFFKETYGSDSVTVSDAHYRGKKMSLADYVDYVAAVPWHRMAGTHDPSKILYLRDWTFDQAHPELLEDFSTPPHFANDWIERYFRGVLAQKFRWLYLGPIGSMTPWHQDLLGTHAWLSQIVGRKEWWLTEPSIDPRGVSLKERGIRPLHVIVEPGDIIFVPGGWWHAVSSLDATVSLTVNFFNASNAVAFGKAWWAQRADAKKHGQAATAKPTAAKL